METVTIIRIVAGILFLLLYFLPSIIGRDRRNAGAIFLVNLLTGWSVIGWVVALIWALTNDPVPVVAVQHQVAVQPPNLMQPAPALLCSGCGKYSSPGARFCQECGAALSETVPVTVQPQVAVRPPTQVAQGSRLKRNFGIVVLIVVVLFVVIAVVNHTSQPDTSTQNASNAAPADRPIILPPLEARFIEIVSMAQADSQRTDNDMQKGGVKARRDKAICNALASVVVSDWIGTVQTIDSNSDGKGVLAILIAPNVLVTTWNNEISDFETHTLIEPGSPVFESASAMKPEQLVAFSGAFFQGSEGDCLREGSMTLDGKLKSPEFIFKFSKVSAYYPHPEPVQTPQKPMPAPIQETSTTSENIMRAINAEDSSPQNQSKPYLVDGDLESDVRRALSTSEVLKSAVITPVSLHREVTLSGTVADEPSRELAGEITSQVPGVVVVHNNLTVGGGAKPQ